MLKLSLVVYLLLSISNIHINASCFDVVEAKVILDIAKQKGIINHEMQSFREFSPHEGNALRGAQRIAPQDVNLRTLLHLRAVLSVFNLKELKDRVADNVIANSQVEFQVLHSIIKGNLPFGIDVPVHIIHYINQLEADRAAAQNQLDRVQRVTLMPESALSQSPNFSPARPRNDRFLHAPTESSLVHTPDRSRALFSVREVGSTALLSSPHSHGVNAVQATPLDKKILKMRREQNALMSPMRRQLTEAEMRRAEAESQRDALIQYTVVLGDAHAESQRVLGLQQECFQYQSQIMRIMSFIEQDTAAMNGDFSRLRDIRSSLEVLKDNLKTTLEALQIISGE